jgi:hypothetical protein
MSTGRRSSLVALLSFARVGRDQHLDAVLGGDVIHVLFVPVLRVGERDCRLVGLTRLLELADRGLDHRPQVREVACGGADLCGDHDLLLVDDRLRVVALDVAAVALHPPRVRIGHAHLSLGDLRRRVGFRRPAQPPRATALLPGCFVCPVATQLGREVLLELLGSNAQPLGPRPRDRTGGPPPFLLQLAMSFSQPPRPTLHPGEDPLGVEPLQRIVGFIIDWRVLLRLAALLLLKRARQPLPTRRLGRELGRQLITARVAVLPSSASSLAIASAMTSRAIRS